VAWTTCWISFFAFVTVAASTLFTSVMPSRNIAIARTSWALASRWVLFAGAPFQKMSYGFAMPAMSWVTSSLRQKMPVLHTEYGVL
jgi:hypothetical protein